MIYLGIDQSYTSSGIVVIEGDNLVHVSVYKTPKTEDVFLRSWEISEHILEVIKTYKVDSVAIEGLAFGIRGNATRDLAGLQFSIVNKVRFIAQKPIVIIPPLTLKKFATRDGKAKKKDMMAAVPDDVMSFMKSCGYKVTTGLTDLSDAYFLAKHIQSQNLTRCGVA